MPIKIKITDPGLFGNDDAEDEIEDIFNSYVLERPEIEDFIDENQRFCIARAYKGDGKSALLRLTHQKVMHSTKSGLTINHSAKAIEPEQAIEDYSICIRKWKSAILSLIANTIGSTIGFAWTDDTMGLVEEAEKNGFKQRSIVSAILSRLKPPKVEANGIKVELPEITTVGSTNPEGIVQRWATGRMPIWLILDDVDKNFENVKLQRMKVASFFDACRELNQSIPELRIRASIRPNVWTAIKFEYESLSHVEQYISDLHWSEEDIRQLLARRIEGYLKRKDEWKYIEKTLPKYTDEAEKQLISLVFEREIEWNKSVRPPHAVLYTLSKHRPRWVIELAKLAAKKANKADREIIASTDIFGDLSEFGRRRVEDTVAEFTSQCSDIQELLTAFNRQPEQLTTDELLRVINQKILGHLHPHITGVIGTPSALNIAAFLFEIGFIYGRRDRQDGSYEHVTYSEKPSLLRSRTSVDDGLVWEVHPVFRQYLEMRDATGKEIRSDKPYRRRSF